jgi:hypothetical protein
MALTASAVVAAAVPAAAAAPTYSLPSRAWPQFVSDLDGAAGLATGRGVTIAVLWSGVDTSASGLSGQSTEGPNYVYKPRAPLAHALGTLISSLIVGSPGINPGLAPDARILGLRIEPDEYEPGRKQFYDSDNYDSNQQIVDAKAIKYAADHGAKVILVDGETSAYGGVNLVLSSAVQYAIRKNVVIVAPESNDGSGQGEYLYPAGQAGVIGVASVTLPGGPTPQGVFGDGQSGSASARNNSVLIAGPGNAIIDSPTGWGIYKTAAAAAYVAATAALIKERHPNLSPALVARAIEISARDQPPGGYSTSVGFGVLDPYAAVLAADKVSRYTPTASAADGAVAAGGHFGTAPAAPTAINALPPDTSEVIASLSGIAVGAILLAVAAVLAVRRRRRRRKPETA